MEGIAEVEVTSEDTAHPIESALLPGRASGWRAGGPGKQKIRLLFSRPQPFDDAFTAIARDGAGAIEVAGRLQKAFASLASIGDAAMREAEIHHSRMALARAENALELPEDLEVVRKLANFGNSVSKNDFVQLEV